jgi:hypothetical protein
MPAMAGRWGHLLRADQLVLCASQLVQGLGQLAVLLGQVGGAPLPALEVEVDLLGERSFSRRARRMSSGR